MKNYESLNASQVAEIKSKYGLIESKVTSVTTLTEKEDVWDVSLLDKETEVPHSIFTNGIVTHNSFQAEYFLAIARHVGAIPAKMPDGEAHQRIFGLQNNDGKWVVPPRIRYYPMSIGEKFFDYVARLMRQLPDKLSKEGKWWLVYDPENKLHKDYIKTKKPEYNEKYYKRTGKWWVETEHGLPQALIITDSYPAMNPEKMDVDDPSAAMAMQARMFSDNIKRIKGKMSAKRITVLGINQLRLRPGVSFGNPEYEPCGEALKFNCFSADTMLQTSKGLLYADELYYETREPKSKLPKIQGVKGLEKPAIYDFMGYSELIEAYTRCGFKLKGKPGHRVCALKKGSFTPAWTSLEEIHNQSDSSYYLPLQLGANVFNAEPSVIEATGKKLVDLSSTGSGLTFSSKELAYLLGYIVAETRTESDCLVLTHKDKSLILYLAYCYATVFGLKEEDVADHISTNGGYYEFLVYDTAAIRMLHSIGLAPFSPNEKKVPWIIRQGRKSEQVSFLSALFECGSKVQKGDITFFSLSDKLLVEVQQMLLNFGIYAKRTATKLATSNEGETETDTAGSLCLSGINAAKFVEEIGFVLDRKKGHISIVQANASNNTFEVIPKFLSWQHQGGFKAYIESLKGTNSYTCLENFEPGWYEDAVAYAQELPMQEKVEMLNCLMDLKKFINYTRKHNLIWLVVEDIKINFEKAPTFDANMPDTHTIITNGFVSHNSDVRIRMASRSVQGGSGQYEEEPSINGGVDQYRYIHMRAHKNKLSVPNLEGWARIWVKDSDGVAHGFDPVYDAFFFMKELGLISGTKNKLKISLKKFEGHKPISWLNFKKLILGSKKVITETLEIIGLSGYINLRQELFDLFKDGKAMEIFFDNKKSNLKDVEDDD